MLRTAGVCCCLGDITKIGRGNGAIYLLESSPTSYPGRDGRIPTQRSVASMAGLGIKESSMTD